MSVDQRLELVLANQSLVLSELASLKAAVMSSQQAQLRVERDVGEIKRRSGQEAQLRLELGQVRRSALTPPLTRNGSCRAPSAARAPGAAYGRAGGPHVV